MDKMYTYHVAVKGKINPSDLCTSSPLAMEMVSETAAATSFTICTDQSGLIGMLRYLHGRSVMILSLFRNEEKSEDNNAHNR